MLGAEFVTEIRVPLFDRLDHSVVLVGIFARQMIVERGVIVEAQEPSAFIEQAAEQTGEVGVATGLGDGDVEIAVGGDHAERVAARHSIGISCLVSTDRDEVLRAATKRGRARGDAIHQRQRLEIDRQLFEIDRRHDGVAVGERQHEAFSGQPHQRLAHRCAGQRELGREPHLVERATGRQLQADDRLLQPLVNRAHAGAADRPDRQGFSGARSSGHRITSFPHRLTRKTLVCNLSTRCMQTHRMPRRSVSIVTARFGRRT